MTKMKVKKGGFAQGKAVVACRAVKRRCVKWMYGKNRSGRGAGFAVVGERMQRPSVQGGWIECSP